MRAKNKLYRISRLHRLFHVSAWKALALFISNPAQDKYFLRIRKLRSGRYLKEPEPWFSCATKEALEDIVYTGIRIFEWGSGASTLWFCGKGAIVRSIEHDSEWYSILSSRVPRQCQLDYYSKESQEYVECLDSPKNYNMFVIDGRRRVDCALKLASLIDKGEISRGAYIVFDDAHRSWYSNAIEQLSSRCEGLKLYVGLSNATDPKITIIYRV